MTANLVETLMAVPEAYRRAIVAELSTEEKAALAMQIAELEANPYFRFRHDAVGFVVDGLGESVWSKQTEILGAIHTHRKVVVAATHSAGKSQIASRAAGAVALSWPADLVRVQTTATNFKQVKGVLWPYINRMHSKYDLPGEVFTTSWKIGPEEVGMGFTASISNEAAVSGFHANGELFLVVDEGGGIHPVLGDAFNNILTGTGHALVIGNFPTDSDDTWFNRIWNSDQWHHIRISAFDTPNFPRPYGKSLETLAEVREWIKIGETEPDHPAVQQGLYETVGICTLCPPTIDQHTIAKHLTDLEWVEDVAAEHGEDSAYYQTRVLARESHDLVDKTLPMSWLERAVEVGKETAATVAPIQLGADIAADGGDEFVIARAQGHRGSIIHKSSGPENANTMHVAAKLLEFIWEAEDYHEQHGITAKVRVKIDEIGVGRGVSDRLKQLAGVPREDGGHDSEIIGVTSSRKAHDPVKFKNQRSEMWWTIRGLMQPNTQTGEDGSLVIEQLEGKEHQRDNMRLLRQLNAPRWYTNSAGQTVVALKSEVKQLTGSSPDRADALLLAFYNPPIKQARKVTVGPIGMKQSNYWAAASA